VIIRILVADDYVPWRRFVCSIILGAGWQVVGQVSAGSEVIQKAQELQPDVVLLDLEVPQLEGLEAARKIRVLAPSCKILCLSICDSADIVTAALDTGVNGYIVKYDVANDLITGIEAVLQGKRFVGRTLKGLFHSDR
jgi:DNA-binding NarL/FixJ family response regulator